MVQKIVRDGKIPLTLVRAGKEMTGRAAGFGQRGRRCCRRSTDGYPPYFVYGPISFTEANVNLFLARVGTGANSGLSWARWFTGAARWSRASGDKEAFPGERLVVVSSPFFPHKLSTGYEQPVRGGGQNDQRRVKIKNLGHLVEVLRDCKDEFITIEF